MSKEPIRRWRELVPNSDSNQEAALLMILDEVSPSNTSETYKNPENLASLDEKLINSSVEDWEKGFEEFDFVEWYATHPNRCWHREGSPTLEKDREENLAHVQEHKNSVKEFIRRTIASSQKELVENIQEKVIKMPKSKGIIYIDEILSLLEEIGSVNIQK